MNKTVVTLKTKWAYTIVVIIISIKKFKLIYFAFFPLDFDIDTAHPTKLLKWIVRFRNKKKISKVNKNISDKNIC